MIDTKVMKPKPELNTKLPVDECGFCWPGQARVGGEKSCGSGTPDMFSYFPRRYFKSLPE